MSDLGFGILTTFLRVVLFIAIFLFADFAFGYYIGHGKGYDKGQQDIRNEYFYSNLKSQNHEGYCNKNKQKL
jgi:hypothetical protein